VHTLGTDPPTSFLNGAGCYAIVFHEGTSASGCAGRVQEAANCETTACDPNFNCAGASPDDQNTCTQSAASGECSTYESTAQTACNKDAGGADSVCSPSDTETFTSFLNLFCGTPPG
jgi:hypothetical protein